MKIKAWWIIGAATLVVFWGVNYASCFAADTHADEMRQHVAKTQGVSSEDLTMGYQRHHRLPLTGQEFYFGKVIDKKTGKAYGVAVDQNGAVVDYEALQAAEKAAYKAKYGKLQPALHDLLETVTEGERVTVGIWLRSGDISPKEPRFRPDAFKIDAENLPKVSPDQSSQSGQGKKESGQDNERVTAMAAAITTQQAEKSEAIEAARKANADHIADQIATLRQPLISDLETKGITPVYVSAYAPLVYIEVPKSAIPELVQRDDVDTIYGPNVNRDLLDSAKPTQKGTIVDNTWGFTGAGIKVALLEDNRIETANPYLSVAATRVPGGATDEHAAATAGIVASNHSTYRGIARGASLYSANAPGYADSEISAAMDWCVSQGVNVINNSWGGNSGTTDLNVHDRHLDYIVRNYFQTVTVAAGNENDGCSSGTGRVTSPARAYNVISVGNYADQDTLTWSGDAMDSCSSYVNPSTGVQKPEVAAVGTSINSTTNVSPWVGNVGSGTSYSAPMVAGLAALLMQRDATLTDWPEPVKAIIMTTALHNIEGNSRLSDYDGAGGVDMRAAFRVVDEYWWNGWGPIDTSTSFPLSSYFYATAGEVVRAAIAFDSTPAGDYSTDALQADLDLYIYDPDGSYVTSSTSGSNNYEIIEFTAPKSGNYELRVTKWSLTGSTYLGTAWWVGHQDLSAYVPQTGGTPPVSYHYYLYDAAPYWNAIGIRSPTGADYDIALYPSSAFGDPSAHTWLEDSSTSQTVDFVVIDCNHATAGNYYPEVSKYSGTGNYQIEAASYSSDTAGAYGPFTFTTSQVLRVWDSWLDSGVRKYFAVKPTAGDADVGMALFKSDSANSSTWYQGRSTAVASADSAGAGSAEIMNFQSTENDWFGLVVWNNGASSTTTFYLYTDTTAPTGSISINSGAAATKSTSVTLTLSASDAETGVYQMRFSSDGSAWSAWEAYGTSKSWTLPAGDGTKTVYVQFKNNAEMVSASYTDTIILDTVAPTGTVSINAGASYTNTTSVTLTLSATDGGSGMSDMRFGNTGDPWSAWEPYGTTKAWTLPTGEGSKTVWVQFRDSAGNISSQYSDSIILDTIAPTGSIVINGGATYTNTTSVTLTLSATDGGSGVYQMRFSNDGSNWSAWETYGVSKAWTLTAGDGTKTVYVQFRDNALNASGSYSDTIILDTAAPTGSIVINGGNTYTNTTSVILTLLAIDGGSGVYQMRFSNDGSNWSAWETYGVSKAWTLTAGDGTKAVYVQFRDNALNASGSYSDTIILDTTALFTIFVSRDGLCNYNNPCWPNIQNAVASASAPSLIMITQETYNEDIIMDLDQEITLQGGWDTSFASIFSDTTIQGSITITNGTLILENIIVK
jgi:hypothetical protein